jgi:GT2 family glycosyltransferase
LIDVIIPVYKGASETRRCTESVLASMKREAFETVVVDDASPDANITAYLDELGRRNRITLARNATNLGFVQSVNRGMAMHPERDVVLLNSDTEVANDWLDRLHADAYSRADIGTVTPFSNNATICSYPFHGWTGGLPGALGLAALDRLFKAANRGRTIELPTAVGFCMYIRRACLDAVGLFDDARFGRGYGEENDFCMRAAAAGWRNVLAGDVFVYHQGAVSFSDERPALTQAAEKALLEAHPDYVRQVREFVTHDPAGALRDAVDRARIAVGTDEAMRVAAEGVAHRAWLMQRLLEAERPGQSSEAVIADLRRGLVHAEALVSERDDEIAKLRAGLQHAETLAFERAAELERIRGLWMWRYMNRVLRPKPSSSK